MTGYVRLDIFLRKLRRECSGVTVVGIGMAVSAATLFALGRLPSRVMVCLGTSNELCQWLPLREKAKGCIPGSAMEGVYLKYDAVVRLRRIVEGIDIVGVRSHAVDDFFCFSSRTRTKQPGD